MFEAITDDMETGNLDPSGSRCPGAGKREIQTF